MPTPYRVGCSVCGNGLDVAERKMDEEGDIFIEVAPCDTCLAVAADEAES